MKLQARPRNKNERIDCGLSPQMMDPERFRPFADLYLKLDTVLRRDMLCHYSGTIPALYWIELCRNPKYSHKKLVQTVNRSFPNALQKLAANSKELTSLSLVSLGPGNGEIDALVLRHLETKLNVRCYYCVDFSFELLRHAIYQIANDKVLKSDFQIRAIWGSFAEPGSWMHHEEGVRLFSLMGFTLGNYSEANLLGCIREQMQSGDFLLLDAHLYEFEDWNGKLPLPEKERLHLLNGYSQEETNRFVFGPVEAATTACASDVAFDSRIHSGMTCVPGAINITIFCKGLHTRMRFTDEVIQQSQIDLATTTFYSFKHLKNWFQFAGFDCVWHKQEGSIGLFLLKRKGLL